MDIMIVLTDAQYKGLQYAAVSPEEWVENAVTNRARIACDEIVKITVDYCLNNNIAVPASRDEIINYAFDNEIVKTAAQRNAEAEAAETI